MKTVYAIRVALAGAAALCSIPVFAQPGNGGAAYSSVANAGDQSATFMDSFIDLARADAKANADLLAALGAADAVAPAVKLSDALGKDSTPGTVGEVIAASEAAHKLALQKLSGKMTLDDAALARFNAGAANLLQTARGYKALTANIATTKRSLQGAGMPARPALAAAKSAPEIAEQLRAEVKAVVAFASANQIALSKDVSDGAAAM